MVRSSRFVRAVGCGVVVSCLIQPNNGVARGEMQPSPGVVVEAVAVGSAAEQAGIHVGDVLLSWVRPASPPANPAEARGALQSPFDVTAAAFEQGPRGPVVFAGTRGNQRITATLSSSPWGVTVRPLMTGPLLAIYAEGKTLIAAKESQRGAARWLDVAEQTQASDPLVSAWLFMRAGDALADGRLWDDAHASYQRALAVVGSDDRGAARARVWEARGSAWFGQNDLAQAASAYDESRRLLERLDEDSLALAGTLHTLGSLAFQRGDLDGAEAQIQRSVAIKQRLAPDSLTLASTLNVLGVLMMNRGDLTKAETHYTQSLAIRERRAPGSPAVAQSLENLGNVVLRRGDLVSAQALFEKSLAIDERDSPEGLNVASGLNLLGSVARGLGDLAGAEGRYRRSLTIRETLAPGTLAAAESLQNLGVITTERGDLAAGEDLYRRALAIRETVAPDGLLVAETLLNLGNVAVRRRDFTTAKVFHERALAIFEKRAPESLDVARALNNLGTVELEDGNLARAKTLKTRALTLRERHAPGSLDVAISLHELGRVDAQRGELASARSWTERALAIQQRVAPAGLSLASSLGTLAEISEREGNPAAALDLQLKALALYRASAPGSIGEASTLHRLAALNRLAGQVTKASEYFAQAIAALEGQMGRLGGAEDVRSSFAAAHADVYDEYVDVLVDQGQPARAFEVLERSRARSLLTMLAERDLLFTADVPADVVRERRSIAADYDRTQARLTQLNPGTDQAQIDVLLARLRQLRDSRESVTQQIRKASPRLAALQHPQPLDAAGAQATLEPGTVLLSYAVGKDRTTLFVVRPNPRVTIERPPVVVVTIPIGEEALREQVAAFRRVIQRRSAPDETRSNVSPLFEQGRRLFDLLIEPARRVIAAADRVLISPDGPLHHLPFGALVQPFEGSRAQPRYFIEWKPLHTVVSATVYAELKKARRVQTPAATTLVAFGDPQYPSVTATGEKPAEVANPELRAVLRRGYDLGPLPASRAEVQAITSHYPGGAHSYVGVEATEERAKAIGKDVRYLHFAAHGLLDERFPLNSALALTIPDVPVDGQDNGLLQAWEIFEHLRIDADLVTLSACETALGKEMGGEGLVGLTRAFQYAGARSVVASLWSVDDDSTAELMTHFYGYLKAGQAKDEALQAAQRDLVRSGRFSQPFHWAAFTLTGDYR